MVGPSGISREAHSLTLISQVSQQDCLNADNEHRIPGLEKPCTIVNLTHLKGESSITVNSLTLCPARKCFAAGAARYLRALCVKTVFQDQSLDAGAQAQACLAFLSSALLQDALQGVWTGGLQHRPLKIAVFIASAPCILAERQFYWLRGLGRETVVCPLFTRTAVDEMSGYGLAA